MVVEGQWISVELKVWVVLGSFVCLIQLSTDTLLSL